MQCFGTSGTSDSMGACKSFGEQISMAGAYDTSFLPGGMAWGRLPVHYSH
jgi:hypothetical protein